jgi:hypothetical protein
MLGLLWIEREHRIVIGSSAATEIALLGAPVCPDNDSVPFSADCIAFIGGDISLSVRPHGAVVENAFSSPDDTQARRTRSASACPPSNETAPYSAACLRFLSGPLFEPIPDAAAR